MSGRAFTARVQSILHNPPETYGDCQRTCLAMLLGIDPLSIPHFADPRDFPEDSTRSAEREWLASQGFGYFQIPVSGEWGWSFVEGILNQQPNTPITVSGKSPRGEWNHDVVWYNGRLHDPHPDATGLSGPCIDRGSDADERWYWLNALVPLALDPSSAS